MNDSQIKNYCIDLLQTVKHCLQCEVDPKKMVPAIDKAIKHLEKNNETHKTT